MAAPESTTPPTTEELKSLAQRFTSQASFHRGMAKSEASVGNARAAVFEDGEARHLTRAAEILMWLAGQGAPGRSARSAHDSTAE